MRAHSKGVVMDADDRKLFAQPLQQGDVLTFITVPIRHRARKLEEERLFLQDRFR